MRVVVKSGSGFIGSHLVDRLMANRDDVIWFDRPNFEFIRHYITEPIRLEVDPIYHLAYPASPVHYQSNPIKTIKTSVLGTMNMLGLAKRVNARLFLASM
jgi:UDP-glucuronate decarboxylase